MSAFDVLAVSASLSARRAWIEIINNNYQDLTRPVALRKESVDRNIFCSMINTNIERSLSARRAWIEIPFSIFWICRMFVALRKESVDRNRGIFTAFCMDCRRSPQGERG